MQANYAPSQGYFGPGFTPPPAPAVPSGAPVLGPDKTAKGFGPLMVLDLGKMIAHPVVTIKSLFALTSDLVVLATQRHLTMATATGPLARYQIARLHLEAAPFRHVLPFFEWGLDKWATGRVKELAPEIQGRLSQRAWHPIILEWPDGGTGHDRLTEALMLNDAAISATDGQIVRAFMGANRVQFKDPVIMDVFYPLGRAGDALILRRNVKYIPGQKTLADTLKAYMVKGAQVNANV